MIDTTYVSTQTIHDIQNASSTVGLKDWLSLIALFLSALVAVLVGQFLQDRKSKKDREYQNKFTIFATILGLRHSKGFAENFVIAVNQIPIVFQDNKKVISKLEKYIATHKNTQLDDEIVYQNLNSDLNDLVIEIAKDLNYTDIDNAVMKTYFYPRASELRHTQDLYYNELFVHDHSDRIYDLRNNQDELTKAQPIRQQED